MFYTVESHVKHLGEAKSGEPVYVTTQLISVDEKRLHVLHRLHRGGDNRLLATGEQMHLHVDTAAAKAAPMSGELRARLDGVCRAHAMHPVPPHVGEPVGSRSQH